MSFTRIPTFASAKTISPIPYGSDAARLALVRATLDADVVDISPVPDEPADGRDGGRVAVLRDRCGCRRLLRVVKDAGAQISDQTGMPSLVISETEAMAGSAVLDMVWGCRRRFVSADAQVRALHHLAEHGTSALIDLSMAVATNDAVGVVLAMACRGLLSVDLDAPIGPETRVKRCEPKTGRE